MAEVVVKDHLMQCVSKLEKLHEEKSEVSEVIKEAFAEAKAKGFDIQALKQVLKLRKLDKDKLAQQEAILELYRDALGV